jgi:DNA-binding NarL/FixJ family response regulator
MRILLADQEANVRFGLRTLLERQPGMQVVGEAAKFEALSAQVKATCPDLVLLDWNLPGIAADELLSTLQNTHPDLSVLVLSGQPEARRVALAAGADAFVGKTDPPEQLLAAILSVNTEADRPSEGRKGEENHETQNL